jgi:hypothetical protein
MYDLSYKLARKSQFRDGYARTLSNFDQAETKILLRDEYNEIDPLKLFDLPVNTKLAYVRRDNGKHVLGAYIVKHMVTKKGKTMTMLAFPPTTIHLSKRAITSGVVRVGAFGNIRFFITPANLQKLFTSRAMASDERLLANEAQIQELTERVRTLDLMANSAINVVQELRNELTLASANILKQKNVIFKLIKLIGPGHIMDKKEIES